MKLGKVVAVHPESHSVDLLILDDGRRLVGVKVMCAMGSSSSGVAGLATPDAQAAPDPFNAAITSTRDLIACVAFYGALPVVQGFLFPTVTEMLFPDADRYINRTASDVYWTVDGKGNAELFHPSGAYVRIGETTAHEDLKKKDYNKSFDPKRNKTRAVNIHIEQAGGVAKVNIAPSGAITVDSSVSLTVTTPLTTFAGDVQVNGKVNTTGDVVAGTVSLKTHKHSGVVAGGSQTGAPV